MRTIDEIVNSLTKKGYNVAEILKITSGCKTIQELEDKIALINRKTHSSE